MLVAEKLAPGHRVHTDVLWPVLEEIFAEAGHDVTLHTADIQHQAVLIHLLVVFFHKVDDVLRRQTKDRHIRIFEIRLTGDVADGAFVQRQSQSFVVLVHADDLGIGVSRKRLRQRAADQPQANDQDLHASTCLRMSMASSISSFVITSGGTKRSTCLPAVQMRSPASAAFAT